MLSHAARCWGGCVQLRRVMWMFSPSPAASMREWCIITFQYFPAENLGLTSQCQSSEIFHSVLDARPSNVSQELEVPGVRVGDDPQWRIMTMSSLTLEDGSGKSLSFFGATNGYKWDISITGKEMFCGVPRIDHDVFGSYVCPADCIQREGMLDRFSTPRIGWEHHLLEWSSFHENRTLIPKDNPPKWFLLRFMAATSIPCCSSELMELISAMVWPQHLNPREDVGFIIQIIQDIDWHWWSSCLGVTRYMVIEVVITYKDPGWFMQPCSWIRYVRVVWLKATA